MKNSIAARLDEEDRAGSLDLMSSRIVRFRKYLGEQIADLAKIEDEFERLQKACGMVMYLMTSPAISYSQSRAEQLVCDACGYTPDDLAVFRATNEQRSAVVAALRNPEQKRHSLQRCQIWSRRMPQYEMMQSRSLLARAFGNMPKEPSSEPDAANSAMHVFTVSGGMTPLHSRRIPFALASNTVDKLHGVDRDIQSGLTIDTFAAMPPDSLPVDEAGMVLASRQVDLAEKQPELASAHEHRIKQYLALTRSDGNQLLQRIQEIQGAN